MRKIPQRRRETSRTSRPFPPVGFWANLRFGGPGRRFFSHENKEPGCRFNSGNRYGEPGLRKIRLPSNDSIFSLSLFLVKQVDYPRSSFAVPFMEEYLVCIQLFEGLSLEDLSEATCGDDINLLRYAVQVAGPTYAEMRDILFRNQLDALTDREDSYPGFNLHPFVTKVEIDEGIVRYYASESRVFSLHAAHQLWSRTDIARARAEFDRWLRSSDAALDTPTNRECAMLRRIMEEAKLIAESAPRQEPPKKTVAYTPRADDEINREIATRQLAYDMAVNILVEATLTGKPIPFSSKIAKQVAQKGNLHVSAKTFRNILSGNQAWKSLMIQAKSRPDREESREYREWREKFDEVLPLLRRELIQRSDAGTSDEERAVSLKKLARLAEKKKKPAKPGSAKTAKRNPKKTTPRKKKSSE